MRVLRLQLPALSLRVHGWIHRSASYRSYFNYRLRPRFIWLAESGIPDLKVRLGPGGLPHRLHRGYPIIGMRYKNVSVHARLDKSKANQL